MRKQTETPDKIEAAARIIDPGCVRQGNNWVMAELCQRGDSGANCGEALASAFKLVVKKNYPTRTGVPMETTAAPTVGIRAAT